MGAADDDFAVARGFVFTCQGKACGDVKGVCVDWNAGAPEPVAYLVWADNRKSFVECFAAGGLDEFVGVERDDVGGVTFQEDLFVEGGYFGALVVGEGGVWDGAEGEAFFGEACQVVGGGVEAVVFEEPEFVEVVEVVADKGFDDVGFVFDHADAD